ncbi:MAG: hypothetical protein JWP23_1516 [Phenylobacterium sp.]|jgi:hypothetical protein|nr:hypothetical protein [Phenylobacterium sp.]
MPFSCDCGRPASSMREAPGSLGEQMTARLRLITNTALAAAFAAGLTAMPARSLAETGAPLAGYWETTNTWVFIFHFTTVERKCFTTADVSGVLQGPSNGHYACTYPTREVGDGHLLLKGTCVEKHGQVAQISAQGTYDPTAFRLTADLRTKIAGVPLRGKGITVAHRIGDVCPTPIPKPQGDGH